MPNQVLFGCAETGRHLARRLLVVTENLDCTRSLSAGELIKAPVQQRCNGVLDRKAGSAEKNPACLATRLLWFIRRTEAIVAEDRLILSGMALVSVMKTSDLRNHYDTPAFWLLHGPRFRSIFGQRQMSSGVVVQVDNLMPIVLNRERSVIRGIRGMGVLSGFIERL
jgi:hypothetical protein